MSDMLKLQVEGRTKTGKGANRCLRNSGMVPGVYYDAHGNNESVKVDFVALSKMVEAAGYSKIFDLEIVHEGVPEARPCLIKAIHHHPLKPMYNHVDFYGVDLDKPIVVAIPVRVSGKAEGVTRGGKLSIFREEVEVECLPKDVPDALELEVTGLGLNQSILVADVDFGENVRAVYDDNFAVVGVVSPRAATEDEEEEGEEEE
ncbi:50S ribosomal protein L25 [Desulfoplanes sp.]